MELEGTVENGVIVPDEAGALPEGTRVSIRPKKARKQKTPKPTIGERLRKFAEDSANTPLDLPADFAINHDHYLYGTPKQS